MSFWLAPRIETGGSNQILEERRQMTPQAVTAVQPVKTSTAIAKVDSEQFIEHVQRLYDSIARRAFEIFDGNGRWNGHDMDDWLKAESEVLHPVHLEISETDGALTVRAEVPGFAANELDIQVDGTRLQISGKHESKEESKKGKTVYSERCAKEVFRSVTLPAVVEGSKAKATLKDGILTIELPKASPAKSVPVETK
jgi:HSP20 family protein